MDGMGYLKTYISCWDDKGLSLGAYSKKVIKTLNFGLVADFRDDKLSGGFSPTHLKNMFDKLDHATPSLELTIILFNHHQGLEGPRISPRFQVKIKKMKPPPTSS